MMAERARDLMALGFTERRARFLVTLMLHAGVFVERHYVESPTMRSAVGHASSGVRSAGP